MKKCILFIMIIIIIGVCGCGQKSEKQRTETDSLKERETNSSDIQTEVGSIQPDKFEDVKQIVKMGEDVEIKLFDQNYKCKVKNVSITKSFRQDISQWNMSYSADVAVKDGKITNGYTIIYINAEVTNLKDKELDYYVSDINPVWKMDDGKLNYLLEMQYFDKMGKGKSAYMIKVGAGKTEEFNIGYIVEDEVIKLPLYLELTAACSSDAYILLPIEDKTLED